MRRKILGVILGALLLIVFTNIESLAQDWRRLRITWADILRYGATADRSVSLGDFNITNVGDIALDSITGDGGTIGIGGTDKFIICQTFTSAGINAAIDALGAEGGEVYLPEGDYDVTATITVDANNTTIRGAGKSTRLLATNRFVYTTVAGTPAAGETLTGDTSGYTATVVQVDTTNKIVWYHSLSNAINYADGEVISWLGGADTTISGTPTEQNFLVIDTNDKTYVTISNLCIFGGSGGGNATNLIGDGDNADYLTLADCWLYRSDAVSIYTKGDYATIRNNYIGNSDTLAVNINTAPYLLVTGNTIDTSTEEGLIIATCNNARVSDNFLTATLFGIYITGSDYVIVSGNTLLTVSRDPISITIGSDYGVVIGNTIYDTGNGYADIKIASDYNVITGNNCYGDGISNIGIYLDEADYCVVSSNFSSNHDVAGIQEDSDCQNNLIKNNNLQDTIRSLISGTAHEGLDEHVTLVDATGLYTLRDAKAGFGQVLASNGTTWALFSFTTAGAVVLQANVNCTTIANNDTTLNIYDSGTAVVIENELGSTLDFQLDIHYID